MTGEPFQLEELRARVSAARRLIGPATHISSEEREILEAIADEADRLIGIGDLEDATRQLDALAAVADSMRSLVRSNKRPPA